MAKLFHISEHTIRFYEKKKLLTPSQISENGYKLYGFRAIRRLEQILALRVLDMPIDHIIRYMDHKDPDIYHEKIQQLEEIVENKINELMAIRSQIRTQVAHVQNFKENGRNIFLKNYALRYLLPVMPLKSEYVFEISVPDFYNHITQTKEHSMLKSSRNLVIYKNKDRVDLCIQIIDHDQSAIDLSRCIKLPAGEYLCMFYNTATKDDYHNRKTLIDDFIKKQELSIDASSVEIYSSNYNIYSEENDSSLLQIHVKMINP